MKKLRINTARFFAFIVAIQILNLSIDAQAFTFLQTKQTVGYSNEINSFVEYFAEIVFEHRDAMPEYQKSSHDNLQLHKNFIIKQITVEERKNFQYPFIENKPMLSQLQTGYTYLYYKEIIPPPPKA